MTEFAQFKDPNFKLAVIQVLMYEQGLLEPKFDVYDFVARYTGRTIDTETEGYAPIPEVRQFFEDLPVPTALLSQVDTLYMDGGNTIYLQVCPLWDGEDDVFNLHSAEDAALLPALKSVTLFYDRRGDGLLQDFRARGVEAAWL